MFFPQVFFSSTGSGANDAYPGEPYLARKARERCHMPVTHEKTNFPMSLTRSSGIKIFCFFMLLSSSSRVACIKCIWSFTIRLKNKIMNMLTFFRSRNIDKYLLKEITVFTQELWKWVWKLTLREMKYSRKLFTAYKRLNFFLISTLFT